MGREIEGLGHNPEKKEQRDRKLRTIFDIGQKLAAAPDRTLPVFPEQADGPKGYQIILHSESLDAAGLGEEFFHGEVTVGDAFTHPEEPKDYPKSVEVSLQKMVQIDKIVRYSLEGIEDPNTEIKIEKPFIVPSDDTDTVVATKHFYINDPESVAPEVDHPLLARAYADWPLEDMSEFTDLQGHNVLPIFARTLESKLTKPDSMDVTEEGWDLITNALREEAKIRDIDLETK